MADLIVIGYPDETTAAAAADEARRLAADLIIQPDAIAVITRDSDGTYHSSTSHHAVGSGAMWGMFWGFLFGLLFFIPVIGLGIGAGMGALGWVGTDHVDLGLSIRTVAVDGERVHLWAGGGITWGSDPATEVAEAHAKAGPVQAALQVRPASS